MFFSYSRVRGRALATAAVVLISAVACTASSDQSAARTQSSTDSSSAPVVAAPADTDDFGLPLPRDASLGQRVVSLNPAATEVIFALGAQAHLVARSRWDEYPKEALSIPEVGDGIRPNIEAVLRAKPTLVLLYATAENRAAVEALTRAGVRTMTLRVDHIAQFATMVQHIGVALGVSDRAAVVVDSVKRTLARVKEVTSTVAPVRVVWPLWQQPAMVVGQGSYLDELLDIAGATNVFHELLAPSPQVSIEEIAKRNPDAIVASAKVREELRGKGSWRAVRAVRDDKFVIDDPALTGRPSVGLGMAAVSLARLLHPDLVAQLPSLPASHAPKLAAPTP